MGPELVADHGSVTWVRGRHGVGTGAVATLATLVLLGLAMCWPSSLCSGLGVMVGMAASAAALSGDPFLRLTTRVLSWGVRRRGRFVTSGQVRLDDVARLSVGKDPRSGRFVLALTTWAGDRFAVGRGASEADLRAFADRVREGLRLDGAREAVEGREWTFLRRPPEALEALVRRPSGPVRLDTRATLTNPHSETDSAVPRYGVEGSARSSVRIQPRSRR